MGTKEMIKESVNSLETIGHDLPGQGWLRIAEEVIAKSDREHPADSVLKTELKRRGGISPEAGGRISHAVFCYFRWFGWLDHESPVADQIREARDLNARFASEPETFTEAELIARAVPSWGSGQVSLSAAWVRSLQAEPHVWLRARLGKGGELASKLGECWVPESVPLRDAVEYRGKEDLFHTPEFHAGEFELQDLSSQVVGLVCDPRPGQIWWDACAGQGGKLLHLSDLMHNKGLIWASDRAEWRLKVLRKRTARAQVFNYRIAPWDGGPKLPTKTKFDGVLVDAPCSGIGTWQRNPQARWTTTPQDVEELGALQSKLLIHAVPSLKPGGKLVYAVCTLSQLETLRVMESVERQFPELNRLPLVNPLRPERAAETPLWLWPQDAGGNGMFIVAWQRPPAKPEAWSLDIFRT